LHQKYYLFEKCKIVGHYEIERKYIFLYNDHTVVTFIIGEEYLDSTHMDKTFVTFLKKK